MRILATLGLCAIVSGCGVVRSTIASYDVEPNGQQRKDYELRLALKRGAADSALRKLAPKGEFRPEDKLLAQLYIGVAAYYAGEYRKSAHALQAAHHMAEDRYTKSVSRGSLSMVTNDRALPYMPGDNERLLVHYYGMLSYLKLGELEDAVVEARRLSYLLEVFDEKRGEMDASTRAVLRYIAGSVFEAAGETNDASVAFRNAAALGGDSAFRRVRMGFPARSTVPTRTVALGSSDTAALGEVVVILEYGFVAHRVEQDLLIAVDDGELEVFAHRDDEKVRVHARKMSDNLMTRMHGSRIGSLEYEVHTNGRRRRGHDHASPVFRDSDTWMKIAWPVYHRPRVLDARPWITLGDGSAAPMPLQADVSDAVVADYNRQAAWLLARAVARAGVKHALAEAAEKAASETEADDSKKKKAKKERDGWIAKVAVQFVGSALERADTRSWQLLPSQVGVLRLQVPAGTQTMRITVPGELLSQRRTVDLGDVKVRPGSLTFVTARVWGDIDR